MAGYQFLEISEAADEIREFIFLNQDVVPAHLKAPLKQLTTTGVSPVDLVAGFVRMVWANRATLPAKPKRIAIAAAELVESKGFHNRLEQRAGRVANALHRDLGDSPPAGTLWPVKADDPVVDAQFVAVVVDPTVTPSVSVEPSLEPALAPVEGPAEPAPDAIV